VFLIYRVSERNSLGKFYIDGASKTHSFIEIVWNLDWAKLGTGSATNAFCVIDVSGSLKNLDSEILAYATDVSDFGVCEQNDIWMRRGLNHLGLHGAGCAIKFGKCFIHLYYSAADGGFLLNHVNGETLTCQIKSSLYSGDAGSDNQPSLGQF
jgi:hypothetical protein